MIGRSGERGSGISGLATRHDDDDDDVYLNFRKLSDDIEYFIHRFNQFKFVFNH